MLNIAGRRGTLARALGSIVNVSIGVGLIAGCASSSGGGSPQSSTAPSSRYVIVQADLERVKADNLLDAIGKLRPEFLRQRNENVGFAGQTIQSSKGTTTGDVPSTGGDAQVSVYKDGVRLAGPDDLRQMLMSSIHEVRFYPPAEAIVKFGSNNAGGVIMVTSKQP